MRRLLFALLFVLVSRPVFAATYNAVDCAVTTIQGLHDSTASNGDTIQLPTCDVTWTSGLTWTKDISVLGNGSGNTILRKNFSGTMFAVTLPSGTHLTRFSSFNLRLTAGTGSYFVVIGRYTDNRRIRLDNILTTDCLATATPSFEPNFLWAYEVFGVVDHNTIHACGQAGLAQVEGQSASAGGDANGDASWNANYAFGSANFLTFENNTFTNSQNTPLTMVDCHAGGRYRFRYNSVTDGLLDGHGPETARHRGCNAIEAYQNTFISSSGTGNYFYIRCCSGVFHHNATYNHGGNPMNLLYFKSSESLTHGEGGSDGRTAWDVNDAGNPYATCSSASAVGSFTVTCAGLDWSTDQWQGYTVRRTYKAGSSTHLVSSMTRSGTTITVNTVGDPHGLTTGDGVSIIGADQTGYNGNYAGGHGDTVTVTSTTQFTVPVIAEQTPVSPATGSSIWVVKGGWFSEISSNTNTEVLTFKAPLHNGAARDLAFVTGDSFEINLVTHGMDQPGRCGGSLVSGTVVTVPAGWNDQSTCGWYEWNNCEDTQTPPRIDCGGGGTNLNFASVLNSRLIRSGVHYFNDTVKGGGYSDYTYPDPLVTCGAITCGGTTYKSNRLRRVLVAPLHPSILADTLFRSWR